MGKSGCLVVLAVVFLISVAPAVAGLRVLTAEKGGEGTGSAKETVPPSPPASKTSEGNNSSPSSQLPKQNQKPAGPVPKNLPPPANPSDSPPVSRTPSSPLAASGNASPLTPVPGSVLTPAPMSGGKAVPVPGSPSHPPSAPVKQLNPSPSSGSPSDKSPASGSPSNPSSSSDGRSVPSSESGSHSAPAKAKLPNPVPSEHGSEASPNGKDETQEEKKKQASSSSDSDDSRGKGQENDKCGASMPSCRAGNLVACVQQSQKESQVWFLLVQNEGENSFNVNISAPASVKIGKPLQILKHQGSKIKFHVDTAEEMHIVLNAGNEDCIISVLPPSPSFGKFFQQFPNYANRVTPIYGVYIVCLSFVFAGGTWACCKLRKRGRRVDAGVAYQQLEMGAQHQASAPGDENMMGGWDDSWNDDWDEEEAMPRPPEKQGSVSENGVNHRSSDKNEWEDWDD